MNCRWLKLTPTDPPKPRARGVQVTATHAAPSGADRPLRAPSSRGPGHGHGRGLRAGRWAQAEGPARLCRSHASSRGSPLAWPAASGLPSPLFPCVHPSAPLAPGLKKPLSVSWVCGLQARAVWPQPLFTATTGGRESQTAFGSWELLGPGILGAKPWDTLSGPGALAAPLGSRAERRTGHTSPAPQPCSFHPQGLPHQKGSLVPRPQRQHKALGCGQAKGVNEGPGHA